MRLKLPTKNLIITYSALLLLAVIAASLFNAVFFKSVNTSAKISRVQVIADNGTTITSLNSETAMNYSFSQLSSSITANEGWEKKTVTINGVKYPALVANNTTSNVSKVTFDLPLIPQALISFLSTSSSDNVQFVYDNMGKHLFKNAQLVTSLELKSQDINKTIYFYPFMKNYTAFIPTYIKLAGLYGITTLLLFILFVLFYRFAISQKIKNKVLMGKNKIILFIIFTCLSVIYFVFILNTGRIVNLGTSLLYDTNFYRFPAIFNEQGKLSLSYYSQHIYLFRGYATQALPIIYRVLIAPIVVSAGINADVGLYYLYFLVISIAIALLFTYILPGIYETLTKKQTYNIQILLCFVIFMLFWGNMIGYIMSDFPGAFFFIISVYLIIRFLKNFSFKTAFLSGITSTLAVLFRTSFIILIYVIILIFIVLLIIILLKKLKKIRFCSINLKILKLIGLAFVFFIAVYIICIPQIAINNRVIANTDIFIPHNGIFPKSDAKYGDSTLVEASMSSSLTSMFFANQVYYPSTLGQTLKNSIYENDKSLDKYEIAYIATSNPLEFVSYIATKAFIAFDSKTNNQIAYASVNTQALFNKMLSLLNYLLIGTLIFVFLNKRYRRTIIGKKQMIMLCGVFLLFCCPLFLLHIEWRYFISYYIFIYYVIFFPVLGRYLEKKDGVENFINGRYLFFIAFYIFLSFTISNTLSYTIRF
jgi:hypothetical protein